MNSFMPDPLVHACCVVFMFQRAEDQTAEREELMRRGKAVKELLRDLMVMVL